MMLFGPNLCSHFRKVIHRANCENLLAHISRQTPERANSYVYTNASAHVFSNAFPATFQKWVLTELGACKCLNVSSILWAAQGILRQFICICNAQDTALRFALCGEVSNCVRAKCVQIVTQQHSEKLWHVYREWASCVLRAMWLLWAAVSYSELEWATRNQVGRQQSCKWWEVEWQERVNRETTGKKWTSREAIQRQDSDSQESACRGNTCQEQVSTEVTEHQETSEQNGNRR
jgi:hypothetical protein